jgi:hypothetical protein
MTIGFFVEPVFYEIGAGHRLERSRNNRSRGKSMKHENGFMLSSGITGFGGMPFLAIVEIKNVLKSIYYPYNYFKLIGPQKNNNYYTVCIKNQKSNEIFKIIINNRYWVMAGITTESTSDNLNFIDLPEEFISQINRNELTILNKEILETKAPENEIKILNKDEIEQIKYWGSKKYGEIIFNNYD